MSTTPTKPTTKTTPHPTVCAPAIVVTRDRLRAMLRLPACSPVKLATFEALVKLTEDHGLEVDPTVEAVLREVAVRFASHRRDINEMLVEGIAPRPGRPGRIEWAPEYHPDRDTRPEVGEDEAVNFYEQCPFNVVECGVQVATLLPPRPGRPGLDVYGKPIAAELPDAYRLVTDGSLNILDDGRVITAQPGLLEHYDDHHLRVVPVLEVPGHIDFSTGNIRFDGSVFVHGDIRDNFQVDCTGNLQVDGVIEAADIHCGGTLRATGGFVGKETGSVHVVSDAWARYLDSVHGRFEGRLAVTREILNSELTVLGDLALTTGDTSGGAIIGGSVIAGRSVQVHNLGSAAGITTQMRLGHVNGLSGALNDYTHDLMHVDQQLARCRQALVDENDPERRAELVMRLDHLASSRTQILQTRAALRRQFEAECHVHLNVDGAIHGGVRLDLPCCRVEILKTIAGPLRILRRPDGKPRFENTAGEELEVADRIRVIETDTW
ncbi:DUF342 domain-containing protein [Planctomycetales bacterium ZRK34]|nr:DUF342 domain-containing protein [Planctomycetales bacterium ZRK34]